MIGVWIPGVLRNGIIILGVQAYWQGIIIGLVLVGTVWFDQYKRTSGGRRPTRPAPPTVSKRSPITESKPPPRGNT